MLIATPSRKIILGLGIIGALAINSTEVFGQG